VVRKFAKTSTRVPLWKNGSLSQRLTLHHVSSYRTKPDDMHKVSSSLQVTQDTRAVQHNQGKPNRMEKRAQC
jgi:hypothetical protein